MTDFDLALKKPFSSFKKLIIGILLSILPIIRWFAYGFILECSKLGKNKSDELPEWKDFGNLFVKGFLATVIQAIYYLPSLLFLLIFGVAAFIELIKVFFETDVFRMVVAGASPESLQPVIQKQIPMIMPYIIKLIPILIVVGILAIIAGYIVPIAVLNYIKNNKFSAAFEKGVFKKAFTGKYFLVRVIVAVINLIIMLILSYVPLVGAAISFFIMGVFSYTLFGQVYLELEEVKEIKSKKPKKNKKKR